MLTIQPQQYLEKIVSFLNDCKGPNFNQDYFDKNTHLLLNYSPKLGKYNNILVVTIFTNNIEIDQNEINIEIRDDIIKAIITDCGLDIKIKNSENYLPFRILANEFILDIKEYTPELANALGW